MSSSNYEVRGNVAVITLASPPVNSLEHALRAGIVAGIDRAQADSSIAAIVLIGTERAFSGGADIRELGTPMARAEPHLATVISVIESAELPVIAAIGGVCLGGGLELALAAHYRVALRDASIGLPEVKLGLLPGAGGTQRLPRLIGVEAATHLIVSGETQPAERFADTALFDALVSENLLEATLTFAERIVAERKPLKRVRDIRIDYPYQQAYFQFVRNMVRPVAGRFPAPLKCIDAVQAACGPFESGIQREYELFTELERSPESRALRHAFFGARAAGKIADIASDVRPRTIAIVGVVGAGTMGGGIAMNFLNAGFPVILVETNQAALDKGVATIRANYENSAKKGKLARTAVDERMALLTATLTFEALGDCDLIIEAVFEELGVKESVFKQLDAHAKPGAILATNTSTLDVDQIARFTQRPRDVLGMHFFSPANVMKLLEVVRGAATAPDVLLTVMRLAKTIGKTAVVSGVCDGFIGNRMIAKYAQMATALVAAGATPWQVDRALETWGMAMGPFRMGDLAGNDISWAIRKRHYAQSPPAIPDVGDRLCELGRFGQKVGKGWYVYPPGGRKAMPDPDVETLLGEYRKQWGFAPRAISDQEIVERCIYALVNEGARIVEEGIAARASDVDIVYLAGYGFPAHRGGPMRYADEIGLYRVARKLREFASAGDPFWEPAAWITQRVAEGRSLT